MIFSRSKGFLFALSLVVTQLAFAKSPELKTKHSWTRTNAGGGGAISMVAATKSGIILAASDLSGVYRSKDKGKTWLALGANNGLTESGINTFGFNPDDGNTFLIGTVRGVYKTKNAGDTIYQTTLETTRPPDQSGKADGFIESIGMAMSDASRGYLAHYEDWNPELTFMATTDAGESWKIVPTQGMPAQARVVKIVVDRKQSDTVYALTGKARFGCSPAQLYKSTNAGKNWSRIATTVGKGVGAGGLDESDILDIDLHPSDSNKLYITTFKAGSCIDDEGKEAEFTSNENADYESYLVGDATAGAVYESHDGGAHFSSLIPKNDEGNLIKGVTGILSVGIKNPATIRVTNVLYPYTWNENAGTWESTDSGQTWKQTGLMSTWDDGYSVNQYFSYTPSFYGFTKTLNKDIFNEDNLFGSFGQWAWGSFDGGKHLNNMSTQKVADKKWLSTGVENVAGHALDVNDSNPDVIYMGGYDIGLWVSKDHGKSWARSQPDYNKYPLYSWDLGTSKVADDIATQGAGSNVNIVLSDPKRDNVVWASFSRAQYEGNEASDFGLFKSTAHGDDWKLVTKGLPSGKKSVRIYGLSIDSNSPTNNRTLYVTVDGSVYQSKDDGDSWKPLLLKAKSGGLKFTQVDQFNSQLVYAGGEGGLWRSQDAGKTWLQVGGSYKTEMQGNYATMRNDIIPTDNVIEYTEDGANKGAAKGAVISLHAWEGVFDIKTDPKVADRVYVTAFGKNKGLYRSDDAGKTWAKLLTDDVMRGVALVPEDSNVVYATASSNYYSGGVGNSSGIQVSEDAGKTWKSANDGMAWNYGGMIEVEAGAKPNVWAWVPGTGLQFAKVAAVLNKDSDNDGMPDAWEDANGLDKTNPQDATQDADNDGLNNRQEFQTLTDPNNPDTDGDGASDGAEVGAGTNPLDAASRPPAAKAESIPSSSTWSLSLLMMLLGLFAFYHERPSLIKRRVK